MIEVGLFWITNSVIIYTWFGYYIILYIVSLFYLKKFDFKKDDSFSPKVTIIVAAYNEEKVIGQRISNLLELNYPEDKLEIIIASDGSTDGTVKKARQFSTLGIKILEFAKNRGKAAAHNDSISIAKGEIIVLTDADSEFEKDFVKKIVVPFSNPNVGCAVGRLIYKSKGTSVAEGESLYWRWELKLRELEDRLGILANGTGACMAFRKELFVPLNSFDDCDITTVIDIIFQGYRVVFVKKAVAYDIPPHSAKSEFKVRIRVTSKTLVTLAKKSNLKGYCTHPVLNWSLLSHRVLRYLTPYFLIVAFFLNILLLGKNLFYQFVFVLQIVFYSLMILGWFGEYLKKRLPVASYVFSFGVAMLGMMCGVAVAIMGRAPTSHKTDDGI